MKNNTEFIKNLKLDKAAIQLLKNLEEEDNRVKNFLIKSYKGLSVSPKIEEVAYNYFISHSIIITAMATYRGSSVITELLYDGLPSPSYIDSYVLQSKAGKAVRARLTVVEKETSNIIKEYYGKGDILIGNLGSGPGRDIIDVLSSYRNIPNIRAIHVDKDEVALERGKRMAKEKGVDHLIEFVHGNFLDYNPSKKFDILVLIGVICPLEIEVCITILKKIKKLLKKDGHLIISNASKKMQREDPFACHIMEWTAHWKLVYKDEEEMKQIFKKAGYIWKKGFIDSYGFHLMGIGVPIS